MELGRLVDLLVKEHEEMNGALVGLGKALEAGDFELAHGILVKLDAIFRQHIADEEGTILRMLISTLGKEGAREAIGVFQQHRPIYKLIQEVGTLSALPPAQLAERRASLQELLAAHTAAEEAKVFPLALSAARPP